MWWYLIVACVFLARVSGLPPPVSEEPQTTPGEFPAENVTVSEHVSVPETSPSESEMTAAASVNSTEAPAEETTLPPGDSADPRCKSDETLIEDPTNCHVLCSKGALFYDSAGRKPNGTECVINIYLVGTKHIESSKPGECFKGQCVERNDTPTTPAPSIDSTTIAATTLPATLASSSGAPATDGGTTETEVPTTSVSEPSTTTS